MLLFKDHDWEERCHSFKFTLFLRKQCTCVDTKDLMIKRYKPLEEAQITEPGFYGPNSISLLVLIHSHNVFVKN